MILIVKSLKFCYYDFRSEGINVQSTQSVTDPRRPTLHKMLNKVFSVCLQNVKASYIQHWKYDAPIRWFKDQLTLLQLRTECTVCADGVFKQKLKMEASKMISRNKINRSFRVKLQSKASERSFRETLQYNTKNCSSNIWKIFEPSGA